MVEPTNDSNIRRLDYQISYRQAVGTNATGPRNPAKKSHELLNGRLNMPPHGTWEFSEPVDWTADPFSDRNWCFQFHGLRWLNVCRQEAFRGNQEACSFWVRTVVSWIQGNPIDDPPTKWSWINMAEALRALEMVYGLPLAEGDDKKIIVDSLEEHGNWLFDDQRIVGVTMVYTSTRAFSSWDASSDGISGRPRQSSGSRRTSIRPSIIRE